MSALAAPCGPLDPDTAPALHVLSVAPGGDLFSSMGHTAVVFTGDGHPAEAYDWGAYDTRQDDLTGRFLRGELPYFLNRQPLESLVARTEHQDRVAVLQTFDVPVEAVRALRRSLELASHPERREYRYHWGTANCATKARDALAPLLPSLGDLANRPVETTARYEASRHLWRWPVPLFAWRFLVSHRLDAPLTAWDRAMLPEHLQRELQPFARRECELVSGRYGWAPATPPGPWPWIALGLTGSIAAVGTTRWPRIQGGLAVLCGGILLGLGVPSLALSAVSELEGIGPTENWLLAGPQSIAFVIAGLLGMRGRSQPRWMRASLIAVAGLAVLTVPVGWLTGTANADIEATLLPAVLATTWGLLTASSHQRHSQALS